MFSFRRQVLYLQIAPQTVTIRLPDTGSVVTEAADIVIEHRGSRRVIAAIGSAASALRGHADVQVYRPFAHPRSIVSCYEEGEALLSQLIKQALGRPWLSLPPRVVIHPLGAPEGDFTQVELRALQAMALAAGARPVHLWTGRVLTDAEVLAAPQAVAGGRWHHA